LRIGIVYSLHDAAATGIVKQLMQESPCSKVYDSTGSAKKALLCHLDENELLFLEFSKEVVFLEPMDLPNNLDFIIIPSRHESSAQIRSFTVHSPGNPWRRSDFGGKPMQLSLSNPILMWYMLQELDKLKNSYSTLKSFSVSYEVTHHGPTIPLKPITFIEIGGSDKEWSIIEAHKAVATAIKNAIAQFSKEQHSKPCIVTVGFGGNHYASLFTKRAFEKGECYGHMVPNYVIKEISLEELKIVAEMVIRFTPGVTRIVIEKMRSELKNAIALIARDLGLEIILT
jgi:D-aminoacyl-tRNA deacylase